ncbi:DUF397 domain-containing protein [Actinomadura scrupuli]|uniref:DUF397 domain-containing protein n=1 Tax=Actinomadura scrupuli TaxID=559629 RepID=UPI003D9899C4
MSRPVWRRSSRSTTQGGECVEVAGLSGVVGVRDSKNPGGPELTFPAAAWHAFTDRIRSGHHDLA